MLPVSVEEGGNHLKFSLISLGLPTGAAVVLMPGKDTTTYSHSQAVRSTSSLWHQLQFMFSGEMRQVNHWKQTASGQLQINQQHPDLSHQPAMLRGKEKLPVTDPLARCWSRGNFRISTFTSSISGRLSISARNIYHCNTFQVTNPCHTDLQRSDKWCWISFAAT